MLAFWWSFLLFQWAHFYSFYTRLRIWALPAKLCLYLRIGVLKILNIFIMWLFVIPWCNQLGDFFVLCVLKNPITKSIKNLSRTKLSHILFRLESKAYLGKYYLILVTLFFTFWTQNLFYCSRIPSYWLFTAGFSL